MHKLELKARQDKQCLRGAPNWVLHNNCWLRVKGRFQVAPCQEIPFAINSNEMLYKIIILNGVQLLRKHRVFRLEWTVIQVKWKLVLQCFKFPCDYGFSVRSSHLFNVLLLLRIRRIDMRCECWINSVATTLTMCHNSSPMLLPLSNPATNRDSRQLLHPFSRATRTCCCWGQNELEVRMGHA